MHILVLADSKIPVPPKGYGGTERIVALLCEGLKKRGHHVTLVGAKNSENYGRLLTYPWAGSKHKLWRAWCKLIFLGLTAREALRKPDVVVAACRPDYLGAIKFFKKPLVYNFHNPIHDHEVELVQNRMSAPCIFVGLSSSHIGKFANPKWRMIFNAVNLESLRFSPGGGDYLAFLGRLTYNKGADIAIRIAHKSGLSLKLAGNVSDEPGGREFFEKEIRPNLTHGVEWVGEINDQQKVDFLGGARALLVPNRWDEPFGIIVAEALACGTPVIASARGSMVELIRPNLNGFLAFTEEEMVNLVPRINEIDRRACRADAEKRFSSDRMVEDYLLAISDCLER